jgi:hypothetical protein
MNNRKLFKLKFFFIELTRVLKVEQEILSDSQLFSLERFLLMKEESFQIETVFDWNIMTIEDLHEINQIDFYKQWKKSICECAHQDKSEQQKEEAESVVDNIEEEESNTVQSEHEEIESKFYIQNFYGDMISKARKIEICKEKFFEKRKILREVFFNVIRT